MEMGTLFMCGRVVALYLSWKYGIMQKYEGEIVESHVMERSNPSTSDIDSISRMRCTQNTVGNNTV